MTDCMLCKGRHTQPVIRESNWQYLRCRNCGLVFLHPQPSPSFLHEHYRHYLPTDPQEVAKWRRLMAQPYARSATLIRERIPLPGRLLDVGCGYGFFLERMALLGWQVEGIEISRAGRSYACDVLGLEVSAQPLPRTDWQDGRYDAVTLFYVIEHLWSPVVTLREVYRLLRPGGLLLLRWPHTTPIVRIVRPWAPHLKLYQAPSHLFDFSPQTIHRMLDGLGFREIHTTICGWTHPTSRGSHLAAWFFGKLGEGLARMSKDHVLLPGVSKTTLARR